jgi:hypothetical protein
MCFGSGFGGPDNEDGAYWAMTVAPFAEKPE